MDGEGGRSGTGVVLGGWGEDRAGLGFILGRGGPAVDVQPRDRDLSDLAGRTANASELISGSP